MKKGAGWICLLMAVFAAAGLLGGCAAGGQKEAAATAALSATTVSPAYDTAEAAETWAAAGRDSGFPAPGQKIGEDSRRPIHIWGGCGYCILRQHPQDDPGWRPGA